MNVQLTLPHLHSQSATSYAVGVRDERAQEQRPVITYYSRRDARPDVVEYAATLDLGESLAFFHSKAEWDWF